MTGKQKRMLRRILVSALLLAAAWIACETGAVPPHWYCRLPLFLIPYAIVGWDVIKRAVQGILAGQLLDERFLMSAATVGALCISEYPEAVFVMLFYQVGELFESIAVGKSRKSIASLMDIRPDEARVERGGSEVTVFPEEVEIGEILVIRPGEKIPLDGVIVDGISDLDTHSLTGESAPRSVKIGEEVLSGCVNLTGLIRIRVTKPFGESTVSKILELVENSALVKSKTETAVTKFAQIYTPLVVGSALLLAVIPSLFTGNWPRWIYSALIFLVVSCPCALVISVPLSYFGGLGAASKKGILIKGASYLEALAKADVMVFDKTGTLTEGNFTVTNVIPSTDFSSELHIRDAKTRILCLAASAESNSNHPIALSILRAADGMDFPAPDSVEELAGRGVRASVGGQTVLVGNRLLMESLGTEVPPESPVGTLVFVACDGMLLGQILIEDVLKSDTPAAIRDLRACGVRRLVMLTGDRPEVASEVAKASGVDEFHASLLPIDKVNAVEKLLAETHGALAFVGDGVNDAPVLARADVGISMGALGSDAAIEASDVVLMADRPSDVAVSIRIARKTRRIAYENIYLALVIKLGFLSLSVFGVVNLWLAAFADVGLAFIAILNAMRAGK